MPARSGVDRRYLRGLRGVRRTIAATKKQKSLSAGVLRLLVRYALNLQINQPVQCNSTPSTQRLCGTSLWFRWGNWRERGARVAIHSLQMV